MHIARFLLTHSQKFILKTFYSSALVPKCESNSFPPSCFLYIWKNWFHQTSINVELKCARSWCLELFAPVTAPEGADASSLSSWWFSAKRSYLVSILDNTFYPSFWEVKWNWTLVVCPHSRLQVKWLIALPGAIAVLELVVLADRVVQNISVLCPVSLLISLISCILLIFHM